MFYNYLCSECGHQEEKMERVGQKKKVYTCPNCEKVSMYRLISKGTSFELKGGGFFSGGWK
jgi:putative FmdB family regulatory protein